MYIKRFFCLIFMIAVVEPALANETAAPKFATVKGRCLTLSIGEQNLSDACEAQIGRSLHADGRTGFYFFLGPTHIVTFSGRPDKDTSRDKTKLESVKLDEVILNDGTGSKSGPQHIAANGSCATSQKSATVFLVNCHGELQKGTKFSASFEIDKSLQ